MRGSGPRWRSRLPIRYETFIDVSPLLRTWPHRRSARNASAVPFSTDIEAEFACGGIRFGSGRQLLANVDWPRNNHVVVPAQADPRATRFRFTTRLFRSLFRKRRQAGWRARCRDGLRVGRADGNLQIVITAFALRQRLEEAIEQSGRYWKRTLRQCLLVVSRHHDAKVSRYG